MEEFPGNSNKGKAAPKKSAESAKKVEKIVTGEVSRRKKPLGKKFTETFVGGDAKGVWSYIFLDVMVPAAKDMIVDAVGQGVERMMFGEVRGGSRRGGSRHPNGFVSYNRYSSSGGRREEPRGISRRARASHDFDEIVLETRAEAEEVVDNLFSLVSQYDAASVADLYDLVGVSGSYQDDKWGWTDLRGAGVTRVKGGYLLDLPRPEPLN